MAPRGEFVGILADCAEQVVNFRRVVLGAQSGYCSIGKLVTVLQKTTAPLETLDLSKTNMTSAGARLVATLLAAEGDVRPLPLRRLILHSNDIDADGYAAIGAAVRDSRCGIREIVVSTHTRDAKSGSRKTVTTVEHNVLRVEEVRAA